MPRTKEQEDRKYGAERKREVIDLCLNDLISKGLAQISVRELSAALKLKKAGIYYYFADKDEAIIECAEEAARRLEFNLIVPALKDIHNPEHMVARLMDRADEMAPTMKLFAQVCADPRYHEKMKPALNRLSERYDKYTQQIATMLNSGVQEVTPCFCMCVIAVTNFMVFSDDYCVSAVMKQVKEKIESLLNR